MALPDKTWRFGKKRSKHREVHARRDVIAARLFMRIKKSRPAPSAGRLELQNGCLSQIAAEALDALAGIFEVGSFSGVGNPERRAEAECGTLYDGDAFALQELGDEILVIGDHLAGRRGLA